MRLMRVHIQMRVNQLTTEEEIPFQADLLESFRSYILDPTTSQRDIEFLKSFPYIGRLIVAAYTTEQMTEETS